jgi:hypothetical protein
MTCTERGFLGLAMICALKGDMLIREYQSVRGCICEADGVPRGGPVSFKSDFRLHQRCRLAAVMQ